MPLDIDFEWQRDEAGYRLVSVGRSPRSQSPTEAVARYAQGLGQIISALGQHAPALAANVANVSQSQKSSQERPHEVSRVEVALPVHERIVRRGGKLVTYRPFEKVNGLFRVFASLARTKEGLLDFVQRFGPLTPAGNVIGEDVQAGLITGQLINSFLNSSPQQRVALLNDGDGISCANAHVFLAVNQVTGRPQLKFKVNDLAHALLLEFGQALANGEEVRQCAFCGEWFDAGPSAKRRRGTKFCSDEHRIAFNSQKRTKR
jgi:hypothetical protein